MKRVLPEDDVAPKRSGLHSVNVLRIVLCAVAMFLFSFYFYEKEDISAEIISAEFISKMEQGLILVVKVSNKTKNDISLWNPDSYIGKDVWSFAIKDKKGVLLRIYKNAYLENNWSRSSCIVIPANNSVKFEFNLLAGDWLWPMANMGLPEGVISREVLEGKKIAVEINENSVPPLHKTNEFEIPELWVGHIQSKMKDIQMDNSEKQEVH